MIKLLPSNSQIGFQAPPISIGLIGDLMSLNLTLSLFIFHIPEGYKAHEDIRDHTYDGISVETNNKVMNQITLHYVLHFVYLS